jgi:hypothetical protein
MVNFHDRLSRSENIDATYDSLIQALEGDAQMHSLFPSSLGWSESEEHVAYLFHDGRPVVRGHDLAELHAIRYGCQIFLEARFQQNPIDALAAKLRIAGNVVNSRAEDTYRELLRRAEGATSDLFPPGNYNIESRREEKRGWLSEIIAERLARFQEEPAGKTLASIFKRDVVGAGAANARTVLRRKFIDRIRMATAQSRYQTKETAPLIRDASLKQTSIQPLRVKFAPEGISRLQQEYGKFAPGYLELLARRADLTDREAAEELGCTPQRWTPKFGRLAKVGSRRRRRSLECHGRDAVTRLS